MKSQLAIPCILMRSGTSKGPFFNRADLPANAEERGRILLAAMGSPDLRQIDGLGGADTLTSKVAMVGISSRPGIDLDYLFTQVAVDKAIADTSPACGNMLAGVGPFALETGMIAAQGDVTKVVIFDENTGSTVEALIQTPDGHVVYGGNASIAGVPGTAAPILLNFSGIVGSKTGSMLPTGSPRDQIDGVDVTLIDVAMPMMIFRASSLGKTGYEPPVELDGDRDFFERVERMRREASRRMGLGDAKDRVIPKVAMVASPRSGGSIAARYFVPHKTHAAFAVTGGLCVASCALVRNSVAAEVAVIKRDMDQQVVIEHPSGVLEVRLKAQQHESELEIVEGGIVRTVRKLMEGRVFVPAQTEAFGSKCLGGSHG